MSFFRTILGLVSAALITACAAAPALSPQQRRALQTRTFEKVDYENVFRAFKTVLQDEGYVIKNQDMNGGLIVANIQKTDTGSGFFAALSGAKNYRTGEGYELSVNLEKVKESITESRLVIQKLESFSMGGQQGQEILDPELYKSFYAKVQTEVLRRKAQGK